MRNLDKDLLVEEISEFLHEIWAGWYKYQRDNSTKENIRRWELQSNTQYENLSEDDKDKDRELAISLIKRF